MAHRYFRCLLLAAATWLYALSVHAQAAGTVDLSGSIQSDRNEALAGTSIVVVHLPTGTRYTVSTDGLGNFAVPNLLAGGPYAIKATQPGFRSQLLTDVFLSASRPMQLELTLLAEQQGTDKRRPREMHLNRSTAQR